MSSLNPLLPRVAGRYLWAVLSCAGIALGCQLVAERVAPTNIAMLFLLGVVVVAARVGRGPAVFCAFLSVAIFDLLFVPPKGSFAVADVQYLITFVVMLAVALLIATLTAGLRQQVELVARRERDSRMLYDVARELTGARSREDIGHTLGRALAGLPAIQASLFLPDDDDRLRRSPLSDVPEAAGNTDPAWLDRTILQTVHQTGRRGGLAGPSSASPRIHYLPLRAPMCTRGVLVVRGALAASEDAWLEALLSVCAVAVERLHYVDVFHATQAKIESERLRHALLSAVSHDLRTPLTALVGLADALLLPTVQLPAAARDIAREIEGQARRLATLVANLLDMARLQAGRVVLRREWQPIEEVIGASLRQLAGELGERSVELDIPATLPPVHIDAVLMERVFCNLIENGAKYSPARSPLRITASVRGDLLAVSVSNQADSASCAPADRVFEMFERGPDTVAQPGVGLGLTICRHIVDAHAGRIEMTTRDSGEIVVEFTLPIGAPPPGLDE